MLAIVAALRNASDQPLLYFPPDCPVLQPVPEHLCVQNIAPTLPPQVTRRIDPLNGGPMFLRAVARARHES